MSKREDLLRHLKQAERRRQRKPSPAAVAPSTGNSSDAAEQLGSVLLELFEQHPLLTDRQVAAAAQAIVHERSSQDPLTCTVQNVLEQSLRSGSVNQRQWRTELLSLVETIRQDFSGGGAQAYLQFLRTLAN